MSEYLPLEKLRVLRKELDALVRAYEHTVVQIPERPLEPFDGLPRVRPHTIPGQWQVWSGSICIALLGPEDVAPIVVAAGRALAEAVPKKQMTHKCPACGKRTRDTTAGCDHCDLEDK